MISNARITVVALLTLALALSLAAGTARAGFMLDKVVAVVNSEVITWGGLYRAMEFEMASGMRAVPDDRKREIFKHNEAAFLEKMIAKRLQLQEVRKHGIGVTEAEVNATIEGIKEKYSLDDDTFVAAIKTEGFTQSQYREKLTEQLAIGRLLDMTVRGKLLVTDEELKEFAGGGDPEADGFYHLRQMFFKATASGNTDEALKKATMALEELRAGGDFPEIAARYSEDPATARSGGDLGFVQRSKMAAEFSAALEGLMPGETAEPFSTSGGVHLIRVETVKSLRDVLLEKRFQSRYVDWLRGLREKAFIEIRL